MKYLVCFMNNCLFTHWLQIFLQSSLIRVNNHTHYYSNNNYKLFSLVKILFITPVNQVLSHVPVTTVTLVTEPHALMLTSAPPAHVTQMPLALTLPEVTHALVTTVTQVMAQAVLMLMSVPQTHVMPMQAVTILQAHGGII